MVKLKMSSPEKKKIVECENMVKIYKTSEIEVLALQGLDLIVEEKELMAIIGNSGSGKSTLLNMIGGLDKPSAGKLMIDGKDLFKFNEKQMVEYKRDTVGFVWQNNARNLIPYLTAKQNIETVMACNPKIEKRYSALELLEMVGLTHRKNSKLGQLSGGEQQRVAIAIGLCNNPKLLLADEPTGSVDTKTTNIILDLFRELNNVLGVTIIIVTHDIQLSKKVDRVVAIRDGRTSSEIIRKRSYADELQNLQNGIQDFSEANKGEIHEELAVIDKVGRVQIPMEYIERIGLKGKNKVKVEMEKDKIILFPPKI
jgi:ABC-type lipoprotein export system ATPase subunit